MEQSVTKSYAEDEKYQQALRMVKAMEIKTTGSQPGNSTKEAKISSLPATSTSTPKKSMEIKTVGSQPVNLTKEAKISSLAATSTSAMEKSKTDLMSGCAPSVHQMQPRHVGTFTPTQLYALLDKQISFVDRTLGRDNTDMKKASLLTERSMGFDEYQFETGVNIYFSDEKAGRPGFKKGSQIFLLSRIAKDLWFLRSETKGPFGKITTTELFDRLAKRWIEIVVEENYATREQVSVFRGLKQFLK